MAIDSRNWLSMSIGNSPSPQPVVFADHVQIQQVVVTLLRNALDALGGVESGRRALCLTSLSRGRSAEVILRDSGQGLPSGASEPLFESFFSTKPEGMGMGLVISRRILEAHGGRIWAESSAEGGATFHFELPCEAEVE